MGRKKTYTPETLARAVTKYFKSISRVVPLTEMVPTDERDDKGHVIYEPQAVVNQLGKQIEVVQYAVPPSVGDLCIFLGIHRSTWSEYCNDEEFSDTTTHARGLMHAYLERESLTRQGKDLKGVLFNLENNYGYSEKITVGGDLESVIKALEDEEGGAQEF